MSGRRPLRVVHTSDVHLGAYSGDSDARWTARRQLMEAAFTRVIDLAVATADLLIIAGDFFDNDRVPRAVVEFAAAQISRFGGPTVLLPGNHDPLDAGRIYDLHNLEAMTPRLRIIRNPAGELIELPELDTVVWGRGYFDSNWRFRPLDGLPGRTDERWHIAMAHGHFIEDGTETERSIPIRESEIAAAAAWDYLALGHWEPHADVSRSGLTAIYSGAPMPLTDANRRAGWAIVADFDDAGVRWSRHRVDPRPYVPDGE